MQNDIYDAFTSLPRYHPGGEEGAMRDERVLQAKEQARQSATIKEKEEFERKFQDDPVSLIPDESVDKYAGLSPEGKEASLAAEQEASQIRKVGEVHDDILRAVDITTRGVRDVTAGMQKGFTNTLSLVVGRENVDAGNQWLRENAPDLTSFTDQYEQGLTPHDGTSEVLQEVSQFAVPFGMYMKGLGALAAANNIKVGAVTTGLLADVITSGTALDPHYERFMALGKELGIENRLIDWLADNGDETESEGRLKNIVDAVGAGGLFGSAFIASALTFKGLWRTGKEIAKTTPRLASGTPQSQRGAVGDLSMDESSRLARAKSMGFSLEDYYHGSSKGGYVDDIDIKEFDPSKSGDKWGQDKDAFFFTKDAKEANYYATTGPIGEPIVEGAVYPVKLKMKKPLIIDSANDLDLGSEGTIGYWDNRHKELIKKAKDGGHDSIKLIDRRDYEPGAIPDEMVAMLKTKNIRSKFAKFDPLKEGSSSLLASAAAAGVIVAPKEAKAERAPKLPRKNLNKKLMIESEAIVDGNVTKIERPAGEVLKEMDSRVKSLEKAVKDL